VVKVFVSGGSNVERRASLRAGIAALRRHCGPLRVSPVYESPAVGFSGAAFYNLVVGFETGKPLGQLLTMLKAIEAQHGRRRRSRSTSRRLDLDLLLYGQLVCRRGGLKLPRPDILDYAFVLKPLTAIAADVLHPVEGCTLGALWRERRPRGPALRRVAFAP